MIPRSLLFVPGDSEKKLGKGLGSGADLLILDLEDSVAQEKLPLARGMVREFLQAYPDRSKQELWVRVNPLATPLALQDLAGVVPGGPDGIMLPKPDSGADITLLGHYLCAFEAAAGLPIGRIKTMPVATETAKALFALGTYVGCSERLTMMTWGAEDIAAVVGASANRGPDGSYDPLFELARTLCLAGAAAAGVAPIDTVYTNFRDSAGLEEESKRVRRAGYLGKIAIHPDQVPVINQAFTPSEEEIAHAERIIAAFAANPGAGTIGLDGKMIDMPHFKQSQKIMEAAARLGVRPSGAT